MIFKDLKLLIGLNLPLAPDLKWQKIVNGVTKNLNWLLLSQLNALKDTEKDVISFTVMPGSTGVKRSGLKLSYSYLQPFALVHFLRLHL